MLLAVCSASSSCHSLYHITHLMVTRWLPQHHPCCYSQKKGKQAVPAPAIPLIRKASPPTVFPRLGHKDTPGFKGTLEDTGTREKGSQE